MDTVIGTCSLCGGAVMVPEVWYSTIPAVPRCRGCGATQRNPYGAVIEMEPPDEMTSSAFRAQALLRQENGSKELRSGHDRRKS